MPAVALRALSAANLGCSLSSAGTPVGQHNPVVVIDFTAGPGAGAQALPQQWWCQSLRGSHRRPKKLSTTMTTTIRPIDVDDGVHGVPSEDRVREL